jgi:hypothetical protein
MPNSAVDFMAAIASHDYLFPMALPIRLRSDHIQKHHFQQFLYGCVRIRSLRCVFIEPLPGGGQCVSRHVTELMPLSRILSYLFINLFDLLLTHLLLRCTLSLFM